ncbi:MAG: hypothetical protein WDZ83_09005 [Rhizobiaceae bacterium]
MIEEEEEVWKGFFARHPNSPVIGRYGGFLMALRRYDEAAVVLKKAVSVQSEVKNSAFETLFTLIRALLQTDRIDEAWQVAGAKAPATHRAFFTAYIHNALGENSRARAALPNAGDNEPSKVAQFRSRLEVIRDSYEIWERVPLKEPIRGLCIPLVNQSALFSVWTGLTVAEMRKHGFKTVVMDRTSLLDRSPTGDADIDALQGLIDHTRERLTDETLPRGKPRHEWTVEPERGVVSACGINFFQPIRERMCTVLRRYTVDFTHPMARAVMQESIAMADMSLTVCMRIHEIAKRRGWSVRFLSGMSHYVPAAVYKLYCRAHRADVDMEYVAYVAAYEHYYSNMGNKVSSALSVQNLTASQGLRMPHRATKSNFDAWCASIPDRTPILERIEKLIAYDRARIEQSPDAAAMMENIERHRAGGGKVICLFGKIPYDIGVDVEGGNAHSDMVDWIRHTVETVGRDLGVMLLIKPHPNEVRKEIASPTETFLDMVGDELPENVFKLKHRWFNVNELLPIMDLGLLWHGTAALELTAKGVPVIVCSTTGNTDFPIGLLQPSDRVDYERMLLAADRQSIPQDLRERAALMIEYLGSPSIMVPYNYGYMPFLRRAVPGFPKWHMEKVEEYLTNGDPNIATMASRAVGSKTPTVTET